MATIIEMQNRKKQEIDNGNNETVLTCLSNTSLALAGSKGDSSTFEIPNFEESLYW